MSPRPGRRRDLAVALAPQTARVARAARVAASLSLLLAALAVPPAAHAQRGLLVNSRPVTSDSDPYQLLRFGGSLWQDITGGLRSAFQGSVTVVPTLSDLSQMLQYDGLWVDQRFNAQAEAREIANLRAFIATGRPVVIIGENGTWGPWNAQILALLGGTEGRFEGPREPGCRYDGASTVLAHPITDGVAAINMGCAGYSIGGEPLFDYAVASLWGELRNVLTILDTNVLDDLFGADVPPENHGLPLDNQRFKRNVAAFAARDFEASAVPEPGTLALLGGGLAAIGARVRRRRARARDAERERPADV